MRSVRSAPVRTLPCLIEEMAGGLLLLDTIQDEIKRDPIDVSIEAQQMQIWVDADACPTVIKEILYRAAERTGVELILVANQPLTTPRSRFIRSQQVSGGFDVADNWIVSNVEAGDLVITADIPLAAEVVAKSALALNPRGQLYTEENVRERLNLRDMMDELRSSGINTGGPAPLSKSDRQTFANQLDRLLTGRQAD